MQNQNSVPATAPPITIKEAITPTITKAFHPGALSFLASCTPTLSVAVLFSGSVVEVSCSDVETVVVVPLVKSLGWVEVSPPNVDSDLLVDISVKGAVVVWFCLVNEVAALEVVLNFVPAVVVT